VFGRLGLLVFSQVRAFWAKLSSVGANETRASEKRD
jgi:hypothetical protein